MKAYLSAVKHNTLRSRDFINKYPMYFVEEIYNGKYRFNISWREYAEYSPSRSLSSITTAELVMTVKIVAEPRHYNE